MTGRYFFKHLEKKGKEEEEGEEMMGKMKGKIKIKPETQLAVWSMPSTINRAVYNSALLFTFCLCRACKSAGRERLGPSQVFSVHISCSGHAYELLDSQEYEGAVQSPYFPEDPTANLSPQAFWCVCCLPQTVSLALSDSR